MGPIYPSKLHLSFKSLFRELSMTMPAFIDFSLLRNSIIKSNTFVSLLPTPSTLQSIIHSIIQTLINCFVSCLAGLNFPEDRNYGFVSPKGPFRKLAPIIFLPLTMCRVLLSVLHTLFRLIITMLLLILFFLFYRKRNKGMKKSG